MNVDVDGPAQNAEVELPAHALLMDGEVENRPDGNGVDTAGVEDSEGLAAQNEKGLAKYSSSTLSGSEELLPKNLTKPKPLISSCSFKVSNPINNLTQCQLLNLYCDNIS